MTCHCLSTLPAVGTNEPIGTLSASLYGRQTKRILTIAGIVKARAAADRRPLHRRYFAVRRFCNYESVRARPNCSRRRLILGSKPPELRGSTRFAESGRVALRLRLRSAD